MSFESAKEKEPHEGTILLMTLEKLVSQKFQKNLRVIGLCQLLYLYIMFIVALMGLLLQDRSVEFCFIRKVPENNGFIDFGLLQPDPG